MVEGRAWRKSFVSRQHTLTAVRDIPKGLIYGVTSLGEAIRVAN